MATKKKNKKTSKKGASKKARLAQKPTTAKKPAKQKAAPSKARAQAKTKTKSLKPKASAKAASAAINETLKKRPSRSAPAFSRGTFSDDTAEPLSGSGDSQGLSRVESADSESVDELADEGNAFEAGVVQGVEDAGERGNREVRTREVPADDVPQEYLDED